jgi:hypothetical protein
MKKLELPNFLNKYICCLLPGSIAFGESLPASSSSVIGNIDLLGCSHSAVCHFPPFCPLKHFPPNLWLLWLMWLLWLFKVTKHWEFTGKWHTAAAVRPWEDLLDDERQKVGQMQSDSSLASIRANGPRIWDDNSNGGSNNYRLLLSWDAKRKHFAPLARFQL